MSWGLVVTGVVAAGSAAYSGSQNKKAQKSATAQRQQDASSLEDYMRKSKNAATRAKAVDAPQVDYLETGRNALTLAGEAYPYFLGLDQKYGPEYARSEVATASARNEAEQQTINRQGLGMRSAILGASPEIAEANNRLVAGLNETGASPLEEEMNRQAMEDLKLGGTLSSEDTRAAVQAARAGSSARGLANGQSGLVSELLGRQAFADARRDQRRAFASTVDAQRTQRRGADAVISGNAFNALGSFWDPQTRIFGRGGSQSSGQVTGPSAYQNYLGGAVNVAQGNQQAITLNNQMDEDARQFGINRQDSLFLSGLNSNASAANAAANRASANASAMTGAAGQVSAAALQAYLGNNSKKTTV